MPSSRPLLALFLAFALLFAQQSGAAHALSHTFEQSRQHDQHSSHTPACEQCATYAQLGSALNVGTYDFAPFAAASKTVSHSPISFRSIHVVAAAARGPPFHLRKLAYLLA